MYPHRRCVHDVVMLNVCYSILQVFNELAYSSLLCLLFHMVNQWVDVITLGGRQKWGKRQHALLPYMCVLVTAVRVGLGIAQWTSVPNGPHKVLQGRGCTCIHVYSIYVYPYECIHMRSLWRDVSFRKQRRSCLKGYPSMTSFLSALHCLFLFHPFELQRDAPFAPSSLPSFSIPHHPS